ncbi:DUF4255 domain-containing protein [Chitinophaga filiformis]|uniref:DUF4255 domain-containing protein n=1 Tax=Chitinophaga filiformis TaxID=104663 RepID=UPI001F3639F6|nr:DUF4255 domain-containing protein [Chitinophaga filiformis]MCF6407755.1 DUF4255 domain-containing protein [Chitinophaga filiformis]
MAVFDLGYVTQQVIKVIRDAFVPPVWTLGLPPEVRPDPPAKVTNDGVSFYLYHIQENSHYKNLPAPGKDQPAVKYVPMALSLFYQLSANSTLEDGTAAYNEQLMMSIAIKALHDHPEINDGNGNRFRIALQPVKETEAVQYWTAGSAPLKLAAYYEVSVVLLEPEEATSYTGRVLTYGTYLFTERTPRITACQNTITFTIPGEAVPRQVVVQPAQAAAGTQIEITGTGFSGGDIELVLVNTRWKQRVIADAPWNVQLEAGGSRITATVQETAVLQESGVPVPVLPGMYAVAVTVIRKRQAPEGGLREFRDSSNQFPFTVSPRIGIVTGPVGNIVTVNGYLFEHADLPEEDVAVYIGEQRLNRDAGGAFAAGEFRVIAPGTMELNLPAGLAAGTYPLRILVAGAESPPRWIVVP